MSQTKPSVQQDSRAVKKAIVMNTANKNPTPIVIAAVFVMAAFDACDVCWPEGKGYVQDGSAMVCRNCGRRFESVLVNEVQGGCNPAPLTRTVQNDQVVIRVADFKAGRSYFNFSKEAA